MQWRPILRGTWARTVSTSLHRSRSGRCRTTAGPRSGSDRGTQRAWTATSLVCSGVAAALGVKRVIDYKFALQNLVVRQAQRTEAVRDPAQTFAGGMRIARARIRGPHDLGEQ